jgi:hypothetical protein
MTTPPPQPPPRRRTALIVLCALYAAVVIPIGLHKGGDVVGEMLQSERWISGTTPLYGQPTFGVFWPPFTIFGLVPFALVARLSLGLAKALYAAANVALLGWSGARLAGRWGWKPVAIAILAVGKPLQGNFENLNIIVVVLALVVASAADLTEGREGRAGVWAGLATAVKAFPALLLVYFAYRRYWRAFVVGVAVAGGATYLSMLRYGPIGAVSAVGDWLGLVRASQHAAGFAFQPLGAMVSELGGGTTTVWIAMSILGSLTFIAVAAGRAREPLYEMGLVTMLAVLISPIAWFYYHTLAVPALVAALTMPACPGAGGRAWTATLVTAGIFLSGVLTFDHMYPDALHVVKHHNYVWGALILVAAMAGRRLVSHFRSPIPT